MVFVFIIIKTLDCIVIIVIQDSWISWITNWVTVQIYSYSNSLLLFLHFFINLQCKSCVTKCMVHDNFWKLVNLNSSSRLNSRSLMVNWVSSRKFTIYFDFCWPFAVLISWLVFYAKTGTYSTSIVIFSFPHEIVLLLGHNKV